MANKESAYVIAFKATSMESRSEIMGWLKECGAVHVLADVWFLKSHYPFAGDIDHEITRFREIDGQLIVLKLNQATDYAHANLSEQASSWIDKNLAE